MQSAVVTNPGDPAAKAAAPGMAAMVPFTRGATEINEPTELDRTITLTAAQQQRGPTDVPARGFLRSVAILVETAVTGTGTAAVYKEDAPWSIIDNVALTDVNGTQIVGPYNGWDLYLMNRWGAYAGFPDPVLSAAYSAPATNGNFGFMLRLPVEVCNRDALGALGNQNASQTYKLHLTAAANTAVYATQPTTQPQFRIRGFLEAWSVPADVNSLGQPQAVLPPAHGTTQNWSKQIFNISAGEQKPQFARVGNLIRALILTFRTTAPARSTTNLPQTLRLTWDARDANIEDRVLRLDYMKRRYGYASLDTGVLVYDFMHDFDGRAGNELRDGYLPTTGGSRLTLGGIFGAAGTLEVLTNDVLPAGDIYLGA